MAITNIANGNAFFIAYQGYGICVQKNEDGQLVMADVSSEEEDSSAEFHLNKFRQRLMEYIDGSTIELDKLAVISPLISLMRRIADKSSTHIPNAEETINETLDKAAKAEALAKKRIADARDMMEEVLTFMLDNNLTIRQLDGQKIEDKSESNLNDLLNRFRENGLGGSAQ